MMSEEPKFLRGEKKKKGAPLFMLVELRGINPNLGNLRGKHESLEEPVGPSFVSFLQASRPLTGIQFLIECLLKASEEDIK